MASRVSVSADAGGMRLLCLLRPIWGFNWAEGQTVSGGWGLLIGIQLCQQELVCQMAVRRVQLGGSGSVSGSRQLGRRVQMHGVGLPSIIAGS